MVHYLVIFHDFITRAEQHILHNFKFDSVLVIITIKIIITSTDQSCETNALMITVLILMFLDYIFLHLQGVPEKRQRHFDPSFLRFIIIQRSQL